ncbi:hypothetical protein RJ45_19500 [Photobacterium gaetbulicola]|uniref:DUF3157 domain-containing protein n=1 Tax=Photobacterium gaetbulicola TaxID=1295392 RepID=A0A0B9GB05_9GAMM|nr:DUF3157 family protein [Photobacterium gaetbulicola]KHT62100.1 hypothetical protein RJ45_19500 [Photobacterium gaetbulicola]
MRSAQQVIIRVAIAGLLFGFIQFVQAATMIATLPDGREVILFEDNTWRYVAVENAERGAAKSPAKPTEAKAGGAGATATATAKGSVVATGGAITASSAASTENQSAMKKSAGSEVAGDLVAPDTGRLVGEYQRSGVVMVAQSASYQDGRLTIPVLLRNEGTDSVILVEVATILRNDKGEVIKRDNHVVWTSIKRMPETYFRPGTEREGKILTFSVPELEHYFLETDITMVERW